MATRLLRIFSSDLIVLKGQQVRYGHRMRGVPPTKARTLQQRLDELNYKDPELALQVNIGLPLPKRSRAEITSKWLSELKQHRSDSEYERKARHRELIIDMEAEKKDWLQTSAPLQCKTIAKHYEIFEHLYGDAYFYPIVPLDIDYDFGSEDSLARVYRGNIIKSDEAKQAPSITYKAESDTLWTLLFTTPDGVLTDANEYCHWFIGNIPGNEVSKGEQLMDYLRPIPPRGVGYCRYIFVLYKQDKKIDYSEYKTEQPCLALEKRSFNTRNFYQKHQDYITPAGLAFYQATWDSSLTDVYHNTLKMEEPAFEYDFPQPYIKPQTWFPLKQPFNLYLDKYRDPKDVNKDYLLKKLKKVHPFKAPEPPLKFPNAHRLPDDMPSWLKLEVKKNRMGLGRINEIE
ncbi:39S ribosomal protein L38, mitochondrial [Cephus cinctus]|uniref:Large ribosomal subunit protein mL38 n=1 Tax=Cephus cinctus TaxID=211228 RepID=A0AAJ7FUP8_CEPCN|nr:39S ribosomal protein L38, mitochondrial [Cephus cinctus]